MEKKIKVELAKRSDYIIENHLSEEIEIEEYDFMEKQFDENSNLIKEITYDSSGEIHEMYTYKFDDENRIVRKIVFFDEEEIVETISHEYNKTNKPVLSKIEYADGSIDEITYLYDENQNLIKKEIINDDGEIEESDIWHFENNKEVFHEHFDDDQPTNREEYEYDEEKRMISSKTWDSTVGKSISNSISYNDQGLRNSILQHDENNKLISKIEVEEFSGENPLIVKEENQAGIFLMHFTYDNNGNPIKQTETVPNGSVISIINRKYNSNNLIEETEVQTDRLGEGINQHYIIRYSYIFWE